MIAQVWVWESYRLKVGDDIKWILDEKRICTIARRSESLQFRNCTLISADQTENLRNLSSSCFYKEQAENASAVFAQR